MFHGGGAQRSVVETYFTSRRCAGGWACEGACSQGWVARSGHTTGQRQGQMCTVSPTGHAVCVTEGKEGNAPSSDNGARCHVLRVGLTGAPLPKPWQHIIECKDTRTVRFTLVCSTRGRPCGTWPGGMCGGRLAGPCGNKECSNAV